MTHLEQFTAMLEKAGTPFRQEETEETITILPETTIEDHHYPYNTYKGYLIGFVFRKQGELAGVEGYE